MDAVAAASQQLKKAWIFNSLLCCRRLQAVPGVDWPP
jgi:hypothetical protein